MRKRIAMFTDDPGWHGAELHRAFSKRGFECINVSLTDCSFEIEESTHWGLYIPGFEEHLPDGVFVRGVPGGTLEEVVFYLDVLHALERLNILVFNGVRAIERSVDKGMTSFLLKQVDVATPPTWVGNNVHQAYSFIRKQLDVGYKVVAKPIFGSQGKNLQLISKTDDLYDFTLYNKIYYLQRFIETGSVEAYDWRLFVINGEVVAAMRRQGTDWITNVATGADCYPAVLDDQFFTLAKNAVSAIGMHYGGVDLMRDQNGKVWVTEVNSIPAWKGLQSVNNIVIADQLCDFFINCLQPQESSKSYSIER